LCVVPLPRRGGPPEAEPVGSAAQRNDSVDFTEPDAGGGRLSVSPGGGGE
jgi:hypothetical protein